MTTIARSPEPSAAKPRRLRAILFHGMVSYPCTSARNIWIRKPGDHANYFHQFQTGPMSDFVQLDLFGDRPEFDRPRNTVSLQPLLPQELSDEGLIAAIPEATLADACALATEAGKRRLSAAVPALMTLCNRFVGYGIDVRVLEQAAALKALGFIGGSEASRAVVQLIVKRIVQGPTLVVAMTVASQLGVIFPTDIALALLRDSNPSVRAPACACVRAGYEVVAALIAMLDDPDGEVSAAAACALGRMGRVEARRSFKAIFDREAFGPCGRSPAWSGGRRSHRLACAPRPRSPRLGAVDYFRAQGNRQREGRVRRLRAKEVCVQGMTLTYAAQPSNLLAYNQCFCSEGRAAHGQERARLSAARLPPKPLARRWTTAPLCSEPSNSGRRP